MADPPDQPPQGADYEDFREQDRFLPTANVARLMKKALPDNSKIAKEAKDCIMECVSEFISFVTSEASDRCVSEKRKTINGEDILWALQSLGFDSYCEVMKTYLSRYREVTKLERAPTSLPNTSGTGTPNEEGGADQTTAQNQQAFLYALAMQQQQAQQAQFQTQMAHLRDQQQQQQQDGSSSSSGGGGGSQPQQNRTAGGGTPSGGDQPQQQQQQQPQPQQQQQPHPSQRLPPQQQLTPMQIQAAIAAHMAATQGGVLSPQ
ncbi:hypothetical protein HDU87_003654 [Geranomyces variabilis]|uniref:Transcription factor CBF/NF-Y/archaeal histone domain-containing protein n=1 Tax=Geranomyces variabilis TaxID=109894 RepID=A0AAD5XME3_9FUNG|nr:hypothetical protein HDU87_003654 [Geranomyces variabilis]